MKNIRRFAIILGTGALIGGCQGPCSKIDLGAPAEQTANVDFSRYVAVGTSISAGYQSGGMVDRHQINSYPAIFARQIGKTVQLLVRSRLHVGAGVVRGRVRAVVCGSPRARGRPSRAGRSGGRRASAVGALGVPNARSVRHLPEPATRW